jgi:hypothetical protein
MTRSRTIALGLTLITLGIFVLSVVAMAQRVGEYYTTQPRALFAFKRVGEREFTFAGRPVSLTDETASGAQEGEVVVIRYGDETLKLLPGVEPKDAQMPGLTRHDDWLRVYRFAEHGRTDSKEFEAKLEEGTDRLAIVARRPVAGPHPRTGIVARRDWKFEFYELLPGGEIKSEALLYPRNRPGKVAKPGQIQEGTWQHDAAMMLMPAFGRPNRSFTTDALHGMGWTLPAAAFSGLVLMFSLSALFAPKPHWPKRPAQAAA